MKIKKRGRAGYYRWHVYRRYGWPESGLWRAESFATPRRTREDHARLVY